MITSKAQMIKVIGETAMRVDPNLTREEKFQIFVRVCDNMLEDGRISKAKHSKWTNIW
jgi:arginyl-tRNA--protein-N-Asp/Glu arginylyltransferase